MTAARSSIGDIASFDAVTADALIAKGVAIDRSWDSAGPEGTPLKHEAMHGRLDPHRAEGASAEWPYVPRVAGSEIKKG